MKELETSIRSLPLVGKKTEEKLNSLGIKTLKDLLFYFPRKWDDFSNIVPISKILPGKINTIGGKVIECELIKSPKKKIDLVLAIISDSTGSVKAVWFNQPFIKTLLKKGEEILLTGKLVYSSYGLVFQNPVFEKIKSFSFRLHTGRIIPTYPETEGISSKFLRRLIKNALLMAKGKIRDYLPEEIRRNQALINLEKAIGQIHFPRDQKELKEAKKRLAFDELFLYQLRSQIEKLKFKSQNAYPIKFDLSLLKNFLKTLPFTLTKAQKKAAWEILKDLAKPIPMNRLLQGEVGSGKTIVATLAILEVVKNGYQVAFMAPTEILAFQHFEKIKNFLSPFGIHPYLLIGSISPKQKEKILKKIKEGEIKLIIGTHALIQKNVVFNKLALVIVDEQHRFGVKQRAAFRKGDFVPHFLSMSATPIPRTLALAIYGDLDISILDELPSNRGEVITYLVPKYKREKAYEFIKEQVANGRQVFVICPLIDKEGDKKDIEKKSVIKEYEKLSKEIFPDLKIGMLHGKLRPKEKEEVIKKFKEKEIEILVSTSVVELGIDFPNANVIMIEDAENFGLAQLHQFRGRVGRGPYKSYCLLFTNTENPDSLTRLKALEKIKNGFKLAELDLKFRGPGEFFGTRQSGFVDFKLASFLDLELVKKVQIEVEKLIKKDPLLNSYPELRKKLEEFQSEIHFE